MPRIMDVEQVHVIVFKSGPQEVFAVHASGHVPTTGWTQIELDAHVYIVPPADGIMDFDFNGKAPDGIVGEVVLPVTAQTVRRMPKWLKGVRVHAKQNAVEELVTKPVRHLDMLGDA
ncbi:hypothetical protein ACFFWD_35580 [Bradyrhizobium erythrophlei]|uniref:hypothetical protein n=1 Tax=Bradyrhizobium erythrophlei TaxID=1437360 RepID=UPI0035E7BF3C